MSKLVIALLITVLIAGSALFVVGGQLVPSVGKAGSQTQTSIQDAFK